MSSRGKYRAWYAAGVLICTLPPALVCIEHFPLWVERGAGTTLSALSLVMLAITLIPLRRALARRLGTPSAWMIWLGVLLISLLVQSVIDSVVCIAFSGAISNILGAVCFRVASIYNGKKKE